MATGRIEFGAEHRGALQAVEIFDLYIPLVKEHGFGSVVEYRLLMSDLNARIRGSEADLRPRLTDPSRGFEFTTDTGFRFGCVVDAATKQWSIGFNGLKLDKQKLASLVKLCERLFQLDDPPTAIAVRRDESEIEFVPKPPIAAHRHVITTTEADVAAAYEDPSIFWKQWAHVLKIGERRLCIRASEAADIENYLAETFEGNMALARHARPGLTEYGLPDARLRQKLERDYDAWWVLGPYSDEKGGLPALTFIGRDANTDVIHYTGFIERDGTEHGRVQIRELIDVKDQGFSDEGDRVPGRVHVLFLDEWMARQERRPLRDVGARVFFYAEDGTKVEIID